MNKYELIYSKQYKKAVKKLNKGELKLVESALNRLANDEKLEPRYKDHQLVGDFKDFRECHIKPNLLLVYQKVESVLILKAINVGSHSEVFR